MKKTDNTMWWLLGGGAAAWLFWPINKAGQYEAGQPQPKTNNFTLLTEKWFSKPLAVTPITVAPVPLIAAQQLPAAVQTISIPDQYYDFSKDLNLPDQYLDMGYLSGVDIVREEW